MSDLHQIFVHVTCGHGSVLLWRRSDMLHSSFMDDVIFAHMQVSVAEWLARLAAV